VSGDREIKPEGLAVAGRLLAAFGGWTASLTVAESLEELCSEYLKTVRGVIPSRGVGIYLFRDGGRPPRVAADGVSDYYLELYEEIGRTIDPVLHAVMSSGETFCSSDLMTASEWQQTKFYKDVLSIHAFKSTLKAPVMSADRIIGTLNFGDREPDAFGRNERILATVLGHVVGLAAPLVSKLEATSKERDQLGQAFEMSEDALIVCDLRTGSRKPNVAARQLLALLSGEEAELLLEDLFSDKTSRHGASDQVINFDHGRKRMVVRSISRTMGQKLIVARLELRNDDLGEVTVAPYAHAMLSPREREVAAAVSLGLHDQQIADSLFLSVHTVKQHLKSIYKKLNVNSRVEMTRVVLIRREK